MTLEDLLQLSDEEIDKVVIDIKNSKDMYNEVMEGKTDEEKYQIYDWKIDYDYNETPGHGNYSISFSVDRDRKLNEDDEE